MIYSGNIDTPPGCATPEEIEYFQRINDAKWGTDIAALLARLEQMYSHRGDGVPTQFVNPDGPEAAATIRNLLRGQIEPTSNVNMREEVA